jgi:hypothetical protein
LKKRTRHLCSKLSTRFSTSGTTRPPSDFGHPTISSTVPTFLRAREGLLILSKVRRQRCDTNTAWILADKEFVTVHGRFSGHGRPRSWIAADIVRIADRVLTEHWDVLQDEATGEESQSRCAASGPANNLSFVLKSNARSICKLGPPPKVQTERNLQNSRLNPDESGSPVDLGCRIPAKCAFFTQKKRILKTKDSLAERGEFELSGDFVNRQ